MFDNDEGLKALEELTDSLRNLFQDETKLKAEGWYSIEEFQRAVLDVIKEFINKL
ncbi:hypothetical protein [uncultured Bacteroides sp.]|uniref:hypothetical protein n=1 Tax=uncultured Bacteroides sp. TaxID=162156 RepID=UPI0025FA4233|nr:hypothetical protein [uncultured Bacteroides sp.]